MFVVAVFAVPCLVAQIISAGRPVLRPDARSLALVACAVLCQLAVPIVPGWARILLPLSFGLGTLAMIRIVWNSSRQIAPTIFAGTGALFNLAPIAWFGSMPVHSAGRARIQSTPLVEPDLIAAKHVDMDFTVHWTNPISLLTDWIAIPAFNAMVSLGDLLLVIAFFLLGAMAHLRPSAEPEGREQTGRWLSVNQQTLGFSKS